MGNCCNKDHKEEPAMRTMASSLPAVYAQINKTFNNYINCMEAFDEYTNDFDWMLEVVRQQQVWGKLIFL